MDSCGAARAVFSRIQNIDPDNAHKIIGYIVLQDHAEKEMIRLAFGPESLIHSVVSKAKNELGLSSNISSAPNSSPSPPAFSPISSPISISRPNPHPLSLSSPRLAHNGFNPSSPSSPSVWSVSGASNHRSLSPDANHLLSHAAAVNGTGTGNGPFSSSVDPHSRAEDCQLQEQNLSFLNEMLGLPSKNLDFLNEPAISPSCRSDSLLYPYFENDGHSHRRSSSVNDISFGSDDSTSGFGYKPCLYFSRGFCKNGSTCKFVHGCEGFVDSGINPSTIVGSLCKFDAFEQYQQELTRCKIAQQQRLATAQYMAGVNLPYNKLNLLQREAQRSAAAALMMGDDFHKLNRFRMGRNDISEMGYGESVPGSRQIYLTFPADSTFKEEDVSNYFSIFGPVQDVRIPYQQKRMFGFVTFVYPETVKIILAKGNPHFVCDSRVLVKPYKEKGKLPDKKQQLDRPEFSLCSSPSGLDCREPFEMHVGPRMIYNNQEMLRKKLEQEANWQQALEFQRRRLMNLQLLDLKNHHRYQHDASAGSSPHSGGHSPGALNRNIPPSTNVVPDEASEENQGSPKSPVKEPREEVNAFSDCSNGNKEDDSEIKGSNAFESFEHSWPDSQLASPPKSTAEDQSIFAPKPVEVDNGVTISTSAADNDLLMPPSSTLNMAPPKSCFLDNPSFSSGHEAVGM